jgi:D-alanine-D-alanine ligase-like ATP-grasp enzyme
MSKRKNILFVNWGTPDKEYTFQAAVRKNLKIFLSTLPNYPSWVKKYVLPKQIIITNTYDSDKLIDDISFYLSKNKVKFDAITTFFEMNVIQTADLAAVLGLPFVSPAAARRSSANKLLMREACLTNNINTPKFVAFKDLKEGLVAFKKIGAPAVIKPIRSGHSYGVLKVKSVSDFQEKFKLAKKHLDADFDEWMAYWQYKDVFLLEEFIEGTVISVDGLVQEGRIMIAGLVEFEMSPEPFFLQQTAYFPSRFSTVLKRKAFNHARRIIGTLGFDNCGFHCEMRLTHRGPVLMEIAARLPGGRMLEGYKNAYGVNLADLYLDISLGRRVDWKNMKRRKFVLHKGVYPPQQGVVEQVKGLRELKRYSWFSVFGQSKVGGLVISKLGIPPSTFYYQIVANSREELENFTQKVNGTYKIVIAKDIIYYLKLLNMKRKDWLKRIKRFFVKSRRFLDQN